MIKYIMVLLSTIHRSISGIDGVSCTRILWTETNRSGSIPKLPRWKRFIRWRSILRGGVQSEVD